LNESKATRYQRLRRRARAASTVSAGLLLALAALSPLGRGFEGVAAHAASAFTGTAAASVALVVFVTLLVAAAELAALPAVLFLALRVDRAYGRSSYSVEDVLGAEVQGAAVAFPAALLAGAPVRLAMAMAGGWWWGLAAVALISVFAGALRVAPALVGRVADVRPLERPDLAGRLEALARRARVPIAGISEWVVADPQAASALVTGVGRHRRVLLSSDIARRWGDDEVMVVVAHELAHHVYRDLWRTMALDAAVLSIALFLADLGVRLAGPELGVADPRSLAALPLMALVAAAVWVVSVPVRYAQSRRQERRADVFALAMTDGAEAFGSAIRRLGARHLAEERPSALTRWLSHRHPPVADRLALAETYRRLRPGQ
jgi:STE24 endopeptidase